MNRDTYIDPVVEEHMPTATEADKLKLMAEIWAIFDLLMRRLEDEERFDKSRVNDRLRVGNSPEI